MNRTCRRAVGALSIALGLAASAPATAQLSVTANGPYYATPSWSQKLTRNRFVVLVDWNHEAVLDRETGLVWQRRPSEDQFTLDTASFQCVRLPNGGRYGWRLPSLPELATLLEPGMSSISWKLPEGHPFDVDVSVLSSFWTTDVRRVNPSSASAVKIESGVEGGGWVLASVSVQYRAWCVRGASGASIH